MPGSGSGRVRENVYYFVINLGGQGGQTKRQRGGLDFRYQIKDMNNGCRAVRVVWCLERSHSLPFLKFFLYFLVPSNTGIHWTKPRCFIFSQEKAKSTGTTRRYENFFLLNTSKTLRRPGDLGGVSSKKGKQPQPTADFRNAGLKRRGLELVLIIWSECLRNMGLPTPLLTLTPLDQREGIPSTVLISCPLPSLQQFPFG